MNEIIVYDFRCQRQQLRAELASEYRDDQIVTKSNTVMIKFLKIGKHQGTATLQSGPVSTLRS